jgi:hypothetical protein
MPGDQRQDLAVVLRQRRERRQHQVALAERLGGVAAGGVDREGYKLQRMSHKNAQNDRYRLIILLTAGEWQV